MQNNYRQRLFNSYSRTHIAYLDADDQSKLDWFLKYTKVNYLVHIDKFDKKSSTILDIGCNKGYLLAALASFGYKNLFGIDLSSEDIDRATGLVPGANLICENAFDYLIENKEKFNVIILKAVLEHTRKDDVITFLERIKGGLKPNGIVIIDVPNMDWLFASHERYMDFTHEIGFTKESLRQVMNNVYSRVQVFPSDNITFSFLGAIKKWIARHILTKLLVWADPEGGRNLIWTRSILGIGWK